MEKARLKVLQFREREKKILDTALKLLLELGEENVSVERIAAEVDIGKGTVYKHFTSKSEIYISLLQDYERDFIEQMDAALDKVKSGDGAAPARLYFNHRIGDPDKAKLFKHLEERMLANGEESEKLDELFGMRKIILDKLNSVARAQIQQGVLRPAPAQFYNITYWALTQGAVEAFHNPTVRDSVDNMDDLMDFIMEVGMHIGLVESGSRSIEGGQ